MRYASLGLVLALACGSGRGLGPTEPTPDDPHVADYPALGFVPEDASYALVAARLRDAVAAVRELLGAGSMFARSSLLPRLPVVGTLSEGALEDAGLDLDGGVAVFSRGLYPTLIVAVGDADAVAATFEGARPGDGVTVRRMDGDDLYTWSEDDLAVSWIVFDHWLAMRVYDPRVDPEEGAWYDRLRSRSSAAGLAGSGQFAGVLADARARLPARPRAVNDVRIVPRRAAAYPGVVGVVRPSRIAGTLPEAAGEAARSCAGLIGGDRVVVAADMGLLEGRGVIVARLSDADAAAVGDRLAPPLPAGFRAFMTTAALQLDVPFDAVAALADLADRCPAMPRVSRRLSRAVGSGSVRHYAFAGREIRPSARAATAALYLATTDGGFVDRLLAKIPGRTFLEKTVQIAGVDVTEVDPRIFPSFHYHRRGDRFIAATGDGVMAAVLGDEPHPTGGEGRNVLSIAIFPPRLPELADTLQTAAWMVGESGRRRARRVAQLLRRYRAGSVRGHLVGPDLVMRLNMRLH